MRVVEAAARALGLQVQTLRASTAREIDTGFTALREGPEQPDALFISSEGFFVTRRVQLAILAAQRSIPAAYSNREQAEAGGLMSYGTNSGDTWRQLGAYVGRILKGAKPADLPVEKASQYQLTINLKTAKGLGIALPPELLARADEVIE